MESEELLEPRGRAREIDEVEPSIREADVDVGLERRKKQTMREEEPD
jgi:hypothetical protein